MTSFTNFHLITIEDIKQLESKIIQPALLSIELIQNYKLLNSKELPPIVDWIKSKFVHYSRLNKLFDDISTSENSHIVIEQLHLKYNFFHRDDRTIFDYIGQYSSYNVNIHEMLIQHFESKSKILFVNFHLITLPDLKELERKNIQPVLLGFELIQYCEKLNSSEIENIVNWLKSKFHYGSKFTKLFDHTSACDSADITIKKMRVNYIFMMENDKCILGDIIRCTPLKTNIHEMLIEHFENKKFNPTTTYQKSVFNRSFNDSNESKELAQALFDLCPEKFVDIKVEYLNYLLGLGFNSSILGYVVIVCCEYITNEEFLGVSEWLLKTVNGTFNSCEARMESVNYSAIEILCNIASDILRGKFGYLYQSFKDLVDEHYEKISNTTKNKPTFAESNNESIFYNSPSNSVRNKSNSTFELSKEEFEFINQDSIISLTPDVLESAFVLNLQLEQDNINYSFRNSLMKLLNDKTQFNQQFLTECIQGGYTNLLKLCLDSTNDRYNNYISMFEHMIKIVKSTQFDDFEIKLKLIKFALTYEEGLHKCVISFGSKIPNDKTSLNEIRNATKIRNYILMNLCCNQEELQLVKIALKNDPTVKIEALILKYDSVNA